MMGQEMKVAPDMINLNTQGNYENIQCIYGAYLASTVISSHSIEVFFDGVYIQQACNVTYCPVDNNVFVEIDRTSFQSHPAVIAMANLGPKKLVIRGSFTVTLPTGNTVVYAVDRLGYAKIIKPGNKP
jgi:hypothetical protein